MCFFGKHINKDEHREQVRFGGLIQFAYWFLSLMYLESLVHFTVYGGFHPRFLYAAGLTAAIAALAMLLISVKPRKSSSILVVEDFFLEADFPFEASAFFFFFGLDGFALS